MYLRAPPSNKPDVTFLYQNYHKGVTKTIVKICYTLLYVIQGVQSIFDEVASWPQLISYLLVATTCLHAASDWPRTFLHPRCFCLA